MPVSSAYVETYMTPGGKDKRKAPPLKRYRVRCRCHANTETTALLHLGSFHKRADAEVWAERARSILAQGLVPNPRTNMLAAPERAGITVSAACRRYLKQRHTLSEETQRNYRSLIKHIDRRLGKRDVATITTNDVRELIADLVEIPLTPAPISSIRSILAGGLDNADIEPNPALHRSIKLPVRATHRVDIPPTEHVVRILQHLPECWRVPIGVIEATGARVAELCGIQHGDLDYARGTIRLVGKGDKARVVPAPPELLALLPAVPAADRAAAGRLWSHATPHGARRALKSACRAAKVPAYTPHKLRHKYASRHVQIGTPPTLVSSYMGHTRTSITLDTYSQTIGDTDEAWRIVLL